ncbi:hypothetical protein BC831DRAFT_442185 [Entophlyctis helioformis]|nr:hypothetical protein BC831DRAFT_442185 [Entophlyctis helioformis]
MPTPPPAYSASDAAGSSRWFANRVSSLTPGSVRLLHNAGAWESIEHKQPYTHMRVWDASSTDPRASLSFDADSATPVVPGHAPAIAWIVQNHLVQDALAQLVKRTPSISLYNSSKVADIAVDEFTQRPVVTLASGQRIHSQLLVGADGANSKVREFAGIETLGWDYNQHGLVATVRISQNDEHDGVPLDAHSRMPKNDTAWQRFLPTGPIAMLPLAEGYASLVWSTRPDLAARFAKAPAGVFVELVNAAFNNPAQDVEFLAEQILADGSVADTGVDLKAEAAWGLSRAGATSSSAMRPPKVVDVLENSRAPFPLRLRNSTTYIGDRLVLIGDAAHTVHPLAGQGLNLGLADAAALARIVSVAARDGVDVGHSEAVCAAYESERYAAGVGMAGAVDTVGRVFGGDPSSAWAQLRGLGMRVVDSSAVLKRLFVGAASS